MVTKYTTLWYLNRSNKTRNVVYFFLTQVPQCGTIFLGNIIRVAAQYGWWKLVIHKTVDLTHLATIKIGFVMDFFYLLNTVKEAT